MGARHQNGSQINMVAKKNAAQGTNLLFGLLLRSLAVRNREHGGIHMRRCCNRLCFRNDVRVLCRQVVHFVDVRAQVIQTQRLIHEETYGFPVAKAYGMSPPSPCPWLQRRMHRSAELPVQCFVARCHIGVQQYILVTSKPPVTTKLCSGNRSKRQPGP
jgi:hypothetical protein